MVYIWLLRKEPIILEQRSKIKAIVLVFASQRSIETSAW